MTSHPMFADDIDLIATKKPDEFFALAYYVIIKCSCKKEDQTDERWESKDLLRMRPLLCKIKLTFRIRHTLYINVCTCL